MGDKLIKVNFGQGLGISLIIIIVKVNVCWYQVHFIFLSKICTGGTYATPRHIDSTATYNWLLIESVVCGSAKKYLLIQNLRYNQSILAFEYDTGIT